MNKDKKETEAFLNEFSKKSFEAGENTIYGIAVPSINIETFAKLKTKDMKISSQDISQFESGAYTGEVSPKMLKSFDVSYAVIGHSERRTYHGETNEVVNAKAVASLGNGIVPVICVGETLEQYENGESKAVVKEQITNSLKGLDFSKIVVAYEPV
jgi:triosephosphate isomerase